MALSTPIARLSIGLLQALSLFLLVQASTKEVWPATDGRVFAPLLAVAVFIPVIIASGLGNLRPRTLTAWVAIAAILCAGLAFHDIAREPVDLFSSSPRTIPSPLTWLSLTIVLFVLHALTLSGEADRRRIASYPTYFDVSWKLCLQAMLAAGFVGVLTGLLFLGGALFQLIKIDVLYDLITSGWFVVPVMALAFNYALHVTDVRFSIVQGTRTLLLLLLSWLLPVMTAIVALFVVALLFTGLEPLWGTRRAAAILLACAAALVLLINAAYQDGRAGTRPIAAVLQYGSAVAAVLLVPLSALAGYALALRIAQYGWTPDRIIALAGVGLCACYGLGYALAAVRSGPSLKGLESTNLLTSLIVVAVLIALQTPLADPARISVADQVSRLEAAEATLDQVDFSFLRFQAGRYGVEALERLKTHAQGPLARAIAERATAVLGMTTPLEITRSAVPLATFEQRAGNIAVAFPDGAALPEGFLRQDWKEPPWLENLPSQLGGWPRCLIADEKCDAVLQDVDDDGKPEIMLFGIPDGEAAVFRESADGTWVHLGWLLNISCPGVRKALLAGNFEMAQPRLKEIEVEGQLVQITPACVPIAPNAIPK